MDIIHNFIVILLYSYPSIVRSLPSQFKTYQSYRNKVNPQIKNMHDDHTEEVKKFSQEVDVDSKDRIQHKEMVNKLRDQVFET